MTDETIFATALEKPDPAERAAFLAEACGDDPERRKCLEGGMVQNRGVSGNTRSALSEQGERGASPRAGGFAHAALAWPSVASEPLVAQQLQPVPVLLSRQQLARALVHTLFVLAPGETPVVEVELQQHQVVPPQLL